MIGDTSAVRASLAPVAGTRLQVLLNLGCGHVQPAGWVNVDGSNRAWLASRLWWFDRLLVALRVLPPTEFNRRTMHVNLTKRFPWAPDSIDGIYMGEFLEHLTREQGEKLLRDCLRVLRPGGVLRLRVPDNARFWRNYLAEFEEARSRPRSQWTLTHSRWVEMFFREICVRPPKLGQSFGHYHKWMYDEISLVKLLEGVGFADVDRAPLHQSRLPGIQAVEARDDLIVEGLKP